MGSLRWYFTVMWDPAVGVRAGADVAFKAGFGCGSGPLTPFPIRIPCAWTFLCTQHQAGAGRCRVCYSCKDSAGGFLGNTGLSCVLGRVICTRVQCLDVCTTNQDTWRVLVCHGFYILLLFNCRWTRKCRVSPAQLWNSQCGPVLHKLRQSQDFKYFDFSFHYLST